MGWRRGHELTNPRWRRWQGVVGLKNIRFLVAFDGLSRPEVSDLDGIPVKRHFTTGCQSGTQVVLYEIDGGGHGWPGGNDLRGPLARRILGDWTKVISASSILIQFFQQYGL